MTHTEIYPFVPDDYEPDCYQMIQRLLSRNQPFMLYFQTMEGFFGVSFQNQPLYDEFGNMSFDNDEERALFTFGDPSIGIHMFEMINKEAKLIVGGPKADYILYIEGIGVLSKDFIFAFDKTKNCSRLYDNLPDPTKFISKKTKHAIPMFVQFFSSASVPSNNPRGKVFEIKYLPQTDVVEKFMEDNSRNPKFFNSEPFFCPLPKVDKREEKRKEKIGDMFFDSLMNFDPEKLETEETKPKKKEQQQPIQSERQRLIQLGEEYTKWVMAEEIMTYLSNEFNCPYVCINSFPDHMKDSSSPFHYIEEHVTKHQPTVMLLGFNTGNLVGFTFKKQNQFMKD